MNFEHFIPLFSIFSLAAILVGSRDHRTQTWKGAIPGSFHKSLVAIGPVVSEEKIFFCKNVWHIKIYPPCNFEVNPITHFGVISLFSSNVLNFKTFRPLFQKL
jgi:hypothetical protein